MKVYVKCSKKSNLELLKSFVGKDEWVVVDILNYYSGKVTEKALIKVNKIFGRVFYNSITLPFHYSSEYDNALDYVSVALISIDNVLRTEGSVLKDCVKVIEPVESYTTEELRKVIEEE